MIQQFKNMHLISLPIKQAKNRERKKVTKESLRVNVFPRYLNELHFREIKAWEYQKPTFFA